MVIVVPQILWLSLGVRLAQLGEINNTTRQKRYTDMDILKSIFIMQFKLTFNHCLIYVSFEKLF